MSKWQKIDPQQIAQECSQKHIQSVLEDARSDISTLVDALGHAIDWLNAFGVDQDLPVLKQAMHAHAKATGGQS